MTMPPLLILILVMVLTNGQDTAQHCIHDNVQKHTADMVIENLFKDMDANGDGDVTLIEVITEIFAQFDDNGDMNIPKDVFINHWHTHYHDVKPFAEYLFYHFDQNNDGRVDMYDMPPLGRLIDINQDGTATALEFGIFMTHLYNDCVPHAHRKP